MIFIITPEFSNLSCGNFLIREKIFGEIEIKSEPQDISDNVSKYKKVDNLTECLIIPI
jgi:hypothetical protein